MDEENAANFIQTLNGVVTYQPLRKVALAKLLGKDGASPLEKETASIGRLIACIKDALLKLRLLHGPSISESLLMDEHIKSLFASIHDDDLVNAFKKIVPTWSEIIERVDGLIQGAVKSWMSTTTSTFRTFINKLLDTQMNYESVLHPDILGAVVDGDEKDTSS